MVFYLVYSCAHSPWVSGHLKKKNKHTNPPMDAKRDIHTKINNGSSSHKKKENGTLFPQTESTFFLPFPSFTLFLALLPLHILSSGSASFSSFFFPCSLSLFLSFLLSSLSFLTPRRPL